MRTDAPTAAKTERLAASVGALLDIKAVATRLACSTKTVQRMISRGVFPPADIRFSKRMLRWRPETIERFINTKSAV